MVCIVVDCDCFCEAKLSPKECKVVTELKKDRNELGFPVIANSHRLLFYIFLSFSCYCEYLYLYPLNFHVNICI